MGVVKRLPSNLGRVAAIRGQYVLARSYYEGTPTGVQLQTHRFSLTSRVMVRLRIYCSIGERTSEGQTLSSSATAARHQGQYSQARS